MIHEGLLQRIELAVSYEPLHRGNGMPVHPHRKLTARVHRLAVDMHRASSAFAAVAAEFGAGEPQVIAQNLSQCPPVIHFNGLGRAIDGQLYGGAVVSDDIRLGRGSLRVKRRDGGRCDQRGAGTFNELAAGNWFLVPGLAHDYSNVDTFEW